MRSLLAVVGLAAFLAAVAFGEEPIQGYDNLVGPDLPGLGNSACKIVMRPIGASQADGHVVTFDSWLAELKHALVAQRQSEFASGMGRLCGPRLFAAAKELPERDSARYAVLAGSFEGLAAACKDGSAAAYETAFSQVCPAPDAIGPAMPPRCDVVVPDPTQADAAPPRRLRLPLFLGRLSSLMQAEQADDEAWRKAMQTVCGSLYGVGGAGFHSHRPLEGTPTFRTVAGAVHALNQACGVGERDAVQYAAAWRGLCPATPQEEAPVIDPAAAAAAAENTPCDTVAKLQERIAHVRSAVQPIVDEAKAAAEAERKAGRELSTEVSRLVRAAEAVEALEQQADASDAALSVPFEVGCKGEATTQ